MTDPESPKKGIVTEDCDADISQYGCTSEGTEEDCNVDLPAMEQQLASLLGSKEVVAQIQQTPSLCALISMMGRLILTTPKKGLAETDEQSVPQSEKTHPSTQQPVTLVNAWATGSVKIRQSGTELHYVPPEVVNGDSVARFTKEDTQSEIDYWSTAVYGHILGASPPFSVMNGYFRRIWQERGIDKVLRVDKDIYLIRFRQKEDQQLVLQWECVQFDNKPVLVSEWTPTYESDSAPQVSVWVRFPKLPIQYWGSSTLSKLASQLRTPIEMDQLTSRKEQANFARVKVRMIVSTCLQESVKYVD